MRVWRIARSIYPALDGEGARRHGARWTSPGIAAVYTAESLALAVVELLVHTDPDLVPRDLAAYEIGVPDTLPVQRVSPKELPGDWREIPGHPACRLLGDAWAAVGEIPLLAVPSAVVPEETNYLLNPEHPQAAQVRVVSSRPFTFDPRLLG
ncbi:MAG TPA: RES family NAD+ phosphorylase [Longimicrobiaceae bacterium]|nr:RES family NAD+ phosphorylase [Longimicrobiaceae bacterium]